MAYQTADGHVKTTTISHQSQPIKTTSISVMNLCVPCENRCRYCLLSYDGIIHGVDYKRSVVYAKRFFMWLRENRPDLTFHFGFGSSMEHPDLLNALAFCQSIGSVTGEFLQFNGMKFRTDEELEHLLLSLRNHGIHLIDLTFYGTESYHDRFSARVGDYQLMIRTLTQAQKIGLDTTVSIPLTHENANQMDILFSELEQQSPRRITCFVPHCEGRGLLLDPVRLSANDFSHLSEHVRNHFNTTRFKTESQWLQEGLPTTTQRALTLTLRPDNMDFFDQLSFEDTISYLEKLDNDYYRVIPSAADLAKCYGDPNGDRYYSARDLCMHYEKRYILDHNLDIYNIHDERQCFSRRY